MTQWINDARSLRNIWLTRYCSFDDTLICMSLTVFLISPEQFRQCLAPIQQQISLIALLPTSSSMLRPGDISIPRDVSLRSSITLTACSTLFSSWHTRPLATAIIHSITLSLALSFSLYSCFARLRPSISLFGMNLESKAHRTPIHHEITSSDISPRPLTTQQHHKPHNFLNISRPPHRASACP